MTNQWSRATHQRKSSRCWAHFGEWRRRSGCRRCDRRWTAARWPRCWRWAALVPSPCSAILAPHCQPLTSPIAWRDSRTRRNFGIERAWRPLAERQLLDGARTCCTRLPVIRLASLIMLLKSERCNMRRRRTRANCERGPFTAAYRWIAWLPPHDGNFAALSRSMHAKAAKSETPVTICWQLSISYIPSGSTRIFFR